MLVVDFNECVASIARQYTAPVVVTFVDTNKEVLVMFETVGVDMNCGYMILFVTGKSIIE